MVSGLIVLILLPALASCQIHVNIQSGGTEELTDVFISGSNVNIISDTERNTFKINDWQLKNAIEKASGGRPDDVYVKSPTPWEDLYSKFNWHQVQTTLRPVRARIIGMTTEPVIVASKVFDNTNFNGSTTFSGSITQQQAHTFTSTWSQTYGLTVGKDIKVGFDIKVLKAESTTSFSFSSSWGKETSTSETTTLGTTSGVEISLAGGQAARAVLSATKGTMTVEIEYEATLSGQVATNYGSKFNGHYFWAHEINSVLQAAGLPTSVKSKQLITAGFFTDDSVSHYDYATGEPLPMSK